MNFAGAGQCRVSHWVGYGLLFASLTTSAFACRGGAQPADLRARYERASALLPWNVQPRIPGLSVELPWEQERRRSEWTIRSEAGNLVAVSSSGVESRLTKDAEPDVSYGLPADSDLKSILRVRGKLPLQPTVVWSPDGSRFAACRTDQRGLRLIPTVLNIRPGQEHQIPVAHNVRTSMPGDATVPSCTPVVFEPSTGRRVDLEIPPLMMAYGPLPSGELQWNETGTRLYATHESRDFRTLTVFEANIETGKARAIVKESSKLPLRYEATAVVTPVGDGRHVVFYSERDGWAHYYLYDSVSGALLNRITRGEWVVREVKHVDARGGWLYFTASGREKNRDPYYAHLYRVRFNGSGLTLLTPEDAHHDITFSPDGEFFVDTHSTVSRSPITTLRAKDGGVVRELASADVSALKEIGWVPPQRIKVKADDGVTDLYGTLYFPADFDPTCSYPIVDAIYSGPQTTWAPVRFLQDTEEAISMAQLGFLILVLDARGTPWRSQEFQDVEFGKHFGSAAIVADHRAAIRQLAQHRPYVDADRAGMYGYSWGGYRTARAMLQFPGFFKVGVAAAGSHDNFNYIFEHDRWFGMERDYPGTYAAQSNLPLAGHLEGKLLLVHGDVDDDVHVANTLQLADALITAGKDFDLFIFPDRGHEDMYHDGYFIRRKWDYFVRHLLGLEPPTGVTLKSKPFGID